MANSLKVKPDHIKNNEIRLNISNTSSQYVDKWIEENNFEDNVADDVSSIPEISSLSDTSSNISISNSNNLSEKFSEIQINSISNDDVESIDKSKQSNPKSIDQLKETITKISNISSSLKNIGNVHVENSRDIHIGNVTYITGPIHVTNKGAGNIGVINETAKRTSSFISNEKNQRSSHIICSKTDAEFREENASREDSFLGNDVQCVIHPTTLRIVPRRAWLAQKPMNPYEYINGPAPYVVISHTATENPTTQSENVLVIRYIQVFHVEGQKWDDIGYNFLIGGDGQAYEGRGWGVVGAHTQGYNKMSVGISFVGCYMKELPTENSINTCKLLIKSGVQQGYIAENYKLVGHCQCIPTESPGRMLYEEIKTWSNFCENPKV